MNRIILAAGLAFFAIPVLAQELPPQQAAFRDAIVTAREAFESAANDLAKGGTRPKRGKAICEAVPSRAVKDWIGTVYELTTNGDGWGVFSVEMEGDIWLSTWNNAFSDAGSNTLIDPSSELFAALAELQEGQQVVFSGSFFKDPTDGDCFDEKSLSLSGSMDQPEFVFDFSAVRPAQ
ncbi:hypothetical protein [Pseudogemmobacter blasticus]|uniref:Uncharacterized protein n=1 Tax=Fuscovulum blasticum DSM 2131 TaxID=1188250 RepID=A0A2T4JDR3_FUSBL|nr:hypothetical protein [Fuscovulum blasticum]PTE15968.1 hypothetical protein C5F44_02710 [Fuscovulum blasticum DSM 2131]